MTKMNDFMTYMMSDDTAEDNMQKLQESQKVRSGGSNVFFRYKKIEADSTATVRFLPISSDVLVNSNRPAFWVDKKVIRLRFDNPDQEGSECAITIPVMQMYKGGKLDDDIILKQVRVLFQEADALAKKGEEDRSKEVRSKASYHWTRGECLAQGFVIRSTLSEEAPENPIRLFELNKQIMNVIRGVVKSEESDTGLEFWPVHGKKGFNFVIKKTKSGDWPSYTTSCFARQPTPWSTEQQDAINTYGLFRLEDFLPARPSEEEYEVLAEIMAASLKMNAGNRIWNPDWEAGLQTVKVFKTNQKESTEEADQSAIAASVQESLSRIGATSDATAEVVSSLSHASTEVDAETEIVKSEARSIIDKIKRGAKAAALAD
jgi:hypothetical protein